MRPGLQPGRIIFAVRRARPLHIGEVVVVCHNGQEFVKRVGRIRGEEIYVLGDDPDNSTDSRTFGWLPLAAVQGTVVWPRLNQRR